MKILMTADAVGGVWTYALELAAALASRDVEVILATMGPRPTREQQASAGSIPNLHLECSDYKLEWMKDPWADVDRAGDWLQDLAAGEAVDLIHMNGYAHGALAWQQPVVVVAHSCVCSWWEAVHGVAPPQEWDEYRRRVTEGLAGADMVVTPTWTFLGSLLKWYRPATRCRVIFHGRCSRLFKPTNHDQRLPILLACGRMWDPAKSMATLDAAVRGLPWKTYAAGGLEAPDGGSVSATTVQCLGQLSPPELGTWLKRAEIFVHPARYEPFGLSVLEAALAGCALVLAEVPSLRELWNGAAVFADMNDPQALHRTLRALIHDPAQRHKLRAAALAHAQQFRPDAMGEAYLSLYRELLAKTREERAVA